MGIEIAAILASCALLIILSYHGANSFYILDIPGALGEYTKHDPPEPVINPRYSLVEKSAIRHAIAEIDAAAKMLKDASGKEGAEIVNISDDEIEQIHAQTCWAYRKINAIIGLKWNDLPMVNQVYARKMSEAENQMHASLDNLRAGKGKDATDLLAAAVRMSEYSRGAVL